MVGATNRRNSYLKAVRKRKIDEAVFHWWYSPDRNYGMYDNLHQYSKNKIHCSCYMCSGKVGMYRGRGVSSNYKISDQRKFDRLAYAE